MKLELDLSWKIKLKQVLESAQFDQLMTRLEKAYQNEDIWPKQENLFTAFNLCPFDAVSVIILGQDPYPTPGHAHGLSFSVPSSIQPLAKSLQNIFKEFESDLNKKAPINGDLSQWAKQGVLLINSVLTVQAGVPQSHQNWGWEHFTDHVISMISEEKDGVIFILWGNSAQKKETLIDKSRHYVIESSHPSPLSAYRGFFGSKPFSKTNELLALQDKQKINW
jgi:uracil-DNA glycosylase